MAMRWRWPPENSCGYLSQVGGAQADGGQRFGGALALLGAAGLGQRLQRLGHDARHGLARVERAVGVLEHHLHIAPRGAQFVASAARAGRGPSSCTLPEVGRSSAITRRAMVDLPEPDSPTMPRLRPGLRR